MKPFLDDNFLLSNDVARELYHEHAANLPIIDYHCHLNPKMIADDYRFGSITELWLGGDHYKWRAMRANGISEKYITGEASDREKFEKWAETMPYCFLNPLYHWTHLELKSAFGIDAPLNPDNAEEIYDECNRQLRNDSDKTTRGLMRRYNVEVVCTTDDPIDSLKYHRQIAESGFEIKVLPTWRPDKAMAIENAANFSAYVHSLEQASGIVINDMRSFEQALRQRHDFFAEMGCKLSDHGLTEFYAEDFTKNEIEDIFSKLRLTAVEATHLTAQEISKFKSAMLLLFGKMDAEKGWTQQFHYGPIRNTNTKMFEKLGPDTGFDSIGEFSVAESLAKLLDRLNSVDALPKTILYNINPNATDMLAAMIGNFQDGSIAAKMQLGSGWWFNDNIDGMTRQMRALGNQGLLSRFVGMLTDSRSFLSYPRHDYFRRLLCNIIGGDVEKGLIPFTGYEKQRLCQMIADISYYNAKSYFGF